MSSGKRLSTATEERPTFTTSAAIYPWAVNPAPNGVPFLAGLGGPDRVIDPHEEPGAVRGVKPSDRSSPPRSPRHYRRHTTDELHEPNHGANGFRAGYLPR